MKRCPTCDKEFPDSMRFCQTDGTVLIDNAPAEDPYKTVVGNQSDIAAAIPPLDPFKTMVASPPPKPVEEDLLQLPEESDQLKTMVVSQDELREELKGGDVPALDLSPAPPLAPSAPLIEPKPPASNDVPPPPPSFGDAGLPKPSSAFPNDAPAVKNPSKSQGGSPFDSKPFENDFSTQSPYGNQENKPIPSPFNDSMPPGYQPPAASPFDAPTPPPFKEPETMSGAGQQEVSNQSPFQPPTPFGQSDPFSAPIEQTGWAPPPAPVSEWGNQDLGANTPFQPPAAAVSGPNQTLAIVSLILGIIGIVSLVPTLIILFCGIVPFLFGIGAIITGFLARKRAKNEPDKFGGAGLAMGGMIGGIISLLVTLGLAVVTVVWIGIAASGGFK